ncbi:MAG: hypothetical protein IPN71_16355 [Fibrobacteres bacterium]|nr:hypothetical protein [Fibrobacterota bacterium]
MRTTATGRKHRSHATPPMTEDAISWINTDELVEMTPRNPRENERKRQSRSKNVEGVRAVAALDLHRWRRYASASRRSKNVEEAQGPWRLPRALVSIARWRRSVQKAPVAFEKSKRRKGRGDCRARQSPSQDGDEDVPNQSHFETSEEA